MFLFDANILIYAFRRDSLQHRACAGFLHSALASDQLVATSSVVELALIRITSHPSLGQAAARPEDAIEFLLALFRQPAWIRVEPGPAHPAILGRLCSDLALRGNDVNDAYLAALALEQDAVLVSADRGFSRFPDLRWHNPLA